MSIKLHGRMLIPQSIVEYCDGIKYENYKTNTPKKFQKHQHNTRDSELMMSMLAEKVGVEREYLDYVFFSVCKGAEEHTDILPREIFHDTTYVIPVILPEGNSVITAEDDHVVVNTGMICEFDHTKPHSMQLDDIESGCVVIMVAVKKHLLH